MTEIIQSVFDIFKVKAIQKLEEEYTLSETERNTLNNQIDEFYNNSNQTEIAVPISLDPEKKVSSVNYMMFYIQKYEALIPFMEIHSPYFYKSKVNYIPEEDASIQFILDSTGELLHERFLSFINEIEFGYKCRIIAFPISITVVMWGRYDLDTPMDNWIDKNNWTGFNQSGYVPTSETNIHFESEKEESVSVYDVSIHDDVFCNKTIEEIEQNTEYSDLKIINIVEPEEKIIILQEYNIQSGQELKEEIKIGYGYGNLVGQANIDLMTNYGEITFVLITKYNGINPFQVRHILSGSGRYYHYRVENKPGLFWGVG